MNIDENPQDLLDALLDAKQLYLTSIESLIPDEKKDALSELQLVLQYRLDTQDMLFKLLQIESTLLHLLGINAHQPGALNIERLRYALGKEDLQLVLTLLQALIDKLKKLASKESLDAKWERIQLKCAHDTQKPVSALEKALKTQAAALEKLDIILTKLDNVHHLPKIAPTLDHISAIEGPISKFFQAVQHGLILSGSLTQQLISNDSLLQIQKPTPAHHPLPPLFMPQKPAPSPARLEERAINRRLTPFFYHP